MLKTYLITYDLKVPGQNYKDTLKIIRSYNWIQLGESSYAICTTESAQDIYNRFKHGALDKTDSLYVIQLHRNYAGIGPDATNKWLEDNLYPVQ